MRPRISQVEAQFLLEVLEKDKANYEQLEVQLNEKMKPLKITVNKACWYVPENAKQLCQLEAEQQVILRKLVIYKGLVAKYRQIAEGKKTRGRYSMEAIDIDSHIIHLKDKVFLGYKNRKMPMVVEAPQV